MVCKTKPDTSGSLTVTNQYTEVEKEIIIVCAMLKTNHCFGFGVCFLLMAKDEIRDIFMLQV